MAKLNPNLRSFWRTRADIKVLKGGRSSSKTWDAAGMAIHLARNYCLTFLCMRQNQNKIEESVYKILKNRIIEFGYESDFIFTKSKIICKETGSNFSFYGIRRNPEEIKGFEDCDIAWIEEAEGLTKDQWETIEPTIRNEGSECWVIYNPKNANDFVETQFKHDPDNGVIVRHINYDENPFISNSMLRKIKRMKDNSFEDYQHIYLGIPLSDSDKVLILRRWLEACVDADIKLGMDFSGSKTVGYDIGDGGKDNCSMTYCDGSIIDDNDNWKPEQEQLRKSALRAGFWALALEADIVYDCIGNGSGTGGYIRDNKATRAVKTIRFNAGGKVQNPKKKYKGIPNKEFFANVKAQTWWNTADRARNTYDAVVNGAKYEPDEMLCIRSTCSRKDIIISELSSVHKDYDSQGRVKVESKDDLAARGIDSPNDADSVIMATNKGVIKSARRVGGY